LKQNKNLVVGPDFYFSWGSKKENQGRRRGYGPTKLKALGEEDCHKYRLLATCAGLCSKLAERLWDFRELYLGPAQNRVTITVPSERRSTGSRVNLDHDHKALTIEESSIGAHGFRVT
jgi:RNA 3'-terminal phosphate cyclase